MYLKYSGKDYNYYFIERITTSINGCKIENVRDPTFRSFFVRILYDLSSITNMPVIN